MTTIVPPERDMGDLAEVALQSNPSEILEPAVDPLLARMRQARDVPAVRKSELATLRTYDPRCVVLVCEGVDDKKVYFHWVRQITQQKFEFLICNGKANLLQFRDSLTRDLTGTAENVYFIVDRDFDGLRGFPPSDDTYITDTYSFENELVSEGVLDNLLAVEMHCHAQPGIREKVLGNFKEVYSSFLTTTQAHNFRIFMARRLGIHLTMPGKINKLADVGLSEVRVSEEAIETVIRLVREPSQQEIDSLKHEFTQLLPQQHYRGKFAMLFFRRWLELLAADRNSDAPQVFCDVAKSPANATCQFSMEAIASRSLPPASFTDFLKAVLSNGDRVVT